MHPNADLIAGFYKAFDARDLDTMSAAYSENPHFRDPAFGDLYSSDVTSMWRMLCQSSTDLSVTASQIRADDTSGSAHWTARYTYSATGRRVVNEVDATFTFDHGRISEHIDHFDFWRWSRQALGPIGLTMGWTPMLRSKVQARAKARLETFTSGA